MSDEVFIDHAELKVTQTKLESIASTDCWGSARSVGEAALGQQRQWGTEQAAVFYRNELALQLSHTQREIQLLCEKIFTLAKNVEDALTHAEATDTEIADSLTAHQSSLHERGYGVPATSSFTKRSSSIS